ncbi:P-loop containing nucleoside triphosphate hydrolase protein [Rhizodiscina lignyota]|uniref:P-loop containing nucleoside triphosphate hydrolase protein n=1 Tax=Rhizodiscina lignyota TaxID=1504668 RepID=A0A9P4IC52_9PEZI|nr:P-loop containing nucleoside triphosphate hydrolase protein [Rhizodiscina lignyota]
MSSSVSITNGINPKPDTHETNGTSPTTNEPGQKKETETGDDSPLGSVCEVKCLAERTSKTGQVELVERDAPATGEKTEHSKYAVVSKQVFNNEGKLEKTILEINSPQLLEALRDTVEFYPAEPLSFETKATYENPFMLLNHYAKDLEQYGDRTADASKKNHIALLMRVLTSEAGDGGIEASKLIQSGLISFKSLWRLFRPGELFYSEEYGYGRLSVVQKIGYGSDPQNGPYLEVSVSFTAHDGVRAGTALERVKIYENRDFVGGSSSKITSLPLYPLEFVSNQQEVIDRLTDRGHRYLKIGGKGIFQYDGLHQYLKPPPEDFYDECSSFSGKWLPQTGSGRVVIDAKTFSEEEAKQKHSIFNVMTRARKGETPEQETFKSLDVDPKLAPPFVFGYNLDTKRWCKFYVDLLEPVNWNPDAMERLIIPPMQKRLISSLISAHEFPEHARNEEQLKGKGLIILLHGTPGSGKTLTAEVAAEHTQRPLLKISTGELGNYGPLISVALRKLLAYASMWRAFVLIDEADVFLETRVTGADALQHNNLVAVFLRQLEYFQGILFLTSNRVGMFDPAIQSRIHLALQYDAPDEERRMRLWKQGLMAVPEHERNAELFDGLWELAKPGLNGREISNSINTAKTLAKGEKSKMSLDHLQTVLGVWSEFQTAVKTSFST